MPEEIQVVDSLCSFCGSIFFSQRRKGERGIPCLSLELKVSLQGMTVRLVLS